MTQNPYSENPYESPIVRAELADKPKTREDFPLALSRTIVWSGLTVVALIALAGAGFSFGQVEVLITIIALAAYWGPRLVAMKR